ncbi:MAG: phosphatidate cytidylyltransferase [Actinobacteria bacterium]|nr:MAG: phosphatidate cytidylyltransferase [Actinomycetota bacterium]
MISKKSEGFRNLRLRVLAGSVGIILLLGALFLGDAPFALVIALVAGLALNEFYGLFRARHYRPNEVLGLSAGVAFPVAAYVFGLAGLPVVAFASVVAAFCWYVAFSQTNFADMAITVAGSFYVGLLLSFLVLARSLDVGVWLVLLILVATWVNDTAAYFVGVALGRSRLAPRVSPGKTWEGTIAGILAAGVVLAALAFFPYLDLVERTILGVVVAAAGVAGDLAESRLKRELDVKDSGKAIPGHGGFLDRFDSLIFAAGTGYYLLTALFKLG